MLEVRYVLSLAHHDISIYGGGEHIPEGELFIKRNALCLTRKTDVGELTPDGIPSKPFFLFGDNTSEKEDFYFAMLKNQERKPDVVNNPPIPLVFEVKDMIGLVQRLHSSEEHMQTRWVNAMLGRVFLSLYKTPDIENFIRAKMTKKISRVKKPTFLSGIVLRRIDMGEGAPFITNPRLKDLTVDGDCVVEGDVRYTGNFRLEIAATARIDLGTRFKAREVNLILAVVFKKVEGHFLVRIKPPPTNRVWMTFAQPPKIDMSIEPIVSSRQITYTVILRQIENRIKEVIAESIVMPFWDDVTFYSTESKRWRGGIFVDDEAHSTPPDLETAAAEDGEVDEVEHLESEVSSTSMPAMEKSISVPTPDTAHSSTYSRKAARSLFNLSGSKAIASTSSVDVNKPSTSEKPKAIRHGSFTSASSPIVSMDVTNVDAFKPTTPPEHSHAASAMAAISARSHPSSPSETPMGSPSRPSSLLKSGSQSSASSGDHDDQDEGNPQLALDTNIDGSTKNASQVYSASPTSIGGASYKSDSFQSVKNTLQAKDSTPLSNKLGSLPDHINDQNVKKTFTQSRRQDSSSTSKSSNDSENPATPPKRITLTAVANAAASAKRWGLNALQRGADQAKDASSDRGDTKPDLSQPMGRGRPLPLPLGTPLPPPDRRTPTAPIPMPKRKPLAPPALPKRPDHEVSQQDVSKPSYGLMPESPATDSTPKMGHVNGGDNRAPPLPKRHDQSYPVKECGKENEDGLFVIAAPPDSEPTTPLNESRTTYLPPFVDDDV